MQITARDLSTLLNGRLEGDPEVIITRPAPIDEATDGCVSFISNPKYESYAHSTKASVLIVGRDLDLNGIKTTLIRVDDPYSSFSQVLRRFNGQDAVPTGVEEPVYIDPTAQLGRDVYIGAFCYIGPRVRIADGVKLFPLCYVGADVVIEAHTIVYPSVTIYPKCTIGKNCVIHSGVVIGSDGFGFAPQADGSLQKVPQIGNVVIEDDVEIGANTAIDRASMGSTRIKRGVKIDNLVQVAHNVEVGEHSAIAALAGVSGSVQLGKHNMIGGQAGFVGHISLADGTKVNAQSGVTKSVRHPGQSLMGSPAVDIKKFYHTVALMYRLPELVQRIEELEQALKEKDK
jgi:UDP-3-O-[3-hydroxymyristoyl] glucosamine N-acyltransferase